MPDNEIQRLYLILDRIEGKAAENHMDVVQRLSRLEANQHTPTDCPSIKRVVEMFEKHVCLAEQRQRDGLWQMYAKEALRVLAAILAAMATIFGYKSLR